MSSFSDVTESGGTLCSVDSPEICQDCPPDSIQRVGLALQRLGVSRIDLLSGNHFGGSRLISSSIQSMGKSRGICALIFDPSQNFGRKTQHVLVEE